MASTAPLELPFRVGISPTLHIRGVIAARNIRKGEIIEKCPLILVPTSQDKHLEETVLKKYYFEWTTRYTAIVLGYGSLINHSYTPNTRYIHDYKNKYLIFKALKNIAEGDEITTNYNYIPYSKAKLDAHLLDFNKHDSLNE